MTGTNQPEGAEGDLRAIPVILLLILALLVLSGGCVKMMEGGLTQSGTPDSAKQAITVQSPGVAAAAAAASTQQPVAEMTPMRSAAVQEVAPYLTPDPYPILHGLQLNETTLYNPVLYGPYEFEKSYKLNGNAAGLLVNVAEGPLYIIYVVTPQNDCTTNPDACRGDLKKPVNRPRLTITVRDNRTHEIVATDGYGGEFSSDTGDYEFEITTKKDDGTEITTTTTPGPRVIRIFREGTYHITLEGIYLSVNVKIKTGASPTSLGSTSSQGFDESYENDPVF